MVAEKQLGLDPFLTPIAQTPEETDFGDRTTIGTAFQVDNPMVNLWNAVTEDNFRPDENFTRQRHLELMNDPQFDVPPAYKPALVRARSEEEFFYQHSKAMEQIRDSQFLAAQGGAGTAAGLLAGILSPTILLPVGAAGTIGIRAGSAAALVAGAEAVDQFAIRSFREGRSDTEFVATVGIGAVLGGAVGALATRSMRNELVSDFVTGERKNVYVSPLVPPGTGGAVGAKFSFDSVRGAKGALGLETVLGGFNPVSRALFQTVTDVSGSAVYLNAQRQLSHGGLILDGAEEGLTATAGAGTVEARTNTYNSFAYAGVRGLQDGYTNYMQGIGVTPVGIRGVDELRVRAGGAGLSYEKFQTEVVRALSVGDVHSDPAIAATAQRLRKEVYEPIFVRAKDVGLLDGLEDLGLDTSYVSRLWDREKIIASGVDFENRLTRDFQNRLNTLAAKRLSEFREAVKKLRAEGGDGIPQKTKSLREKLIRSIEDLGATKVDPDTGLIEFGTHARDSARETIKIMKSDSAVPPGLAVLRAERGPVLARVLDVKTEDYLDVLDTDLENGILNYSHIMGADIELTGRFGDTTGAGIKSAADIELQQKLDLINGSDISETAKRKARTDLEEEFRQFGNSFDVQIARLRRMHGVPNGPNKLNSLFRAGRHLTAASSLGMAGLASLADMGGAIIEHGFIDAFRFGLRPMITNFNEVKVQRDIARSAGLAVDMILNTRASKLLDDVAVYQSMTKAERFSEQAARKVIQLSGLNLITDAAQTINASIFVNKTFRDIDTLINKAGTGAAAKAKGRLARNEIDEKTARQFWNAMGTENGGGQVNGVWLPNLEEWPLNLADNFRAAMNRSGTQTVVIPGLEVPNVLGSSEAARIFLQFWSFSLSATNKIALRAAQKRDAGVLQGIVFMVGLGMMTDYFKAVLGGKHEEYAKQSVAKKVAAGVGASGLLGIMSLPLEFATATNANFAIRGSLIPAATQKAGTLGSAAFNIVSPGKEIKPSDINNVVRSVPGNNLFWLRGAFEALAD